MSKPPAPFLVHVGVLKSARPGRVEGCSPGGVRRSDGRRRLPKGVVSTIETHDLDDAKQVARTPLKLERKHST